MTTATMKASKKPVKAKKEKLDNTTKPATPGEAKLAKERAKSNRPAPKEVAPIIEQPAPPKKDSFYIPVDTLPIVLAAAGRDPREILKSVHATASKGHHILEAANGLILLRASWNDDAFESLELDTIIPRAAWNDVAAATGAVRELGQTNTKGRAAVMITGPEANHKIDFLPVRGVYPAIENILPKPWGTAPAPNAYHETRIDIKRMEKLLKALVKAGAQNAVMHLSDKPNDPIIFTAEVDPISFIGVIMPLRSPDESERPLDEDGDTIPVKPPEGAEEEDKSTPPLFDADGNPTPEASQERDPKMKEYTDKELVGIIENGDPDEAQAALDEQDFRKHAEMGNQE